MNDRKMGMDGFRSANEHQNKIIVKTGSATIDRKNLVVKINSDNDRS